jgi:hypothetical protein
VQVKTSTNLLRQEKEKSRDEAADISFVGSARYRNGAVDGHQRASARCDTDAAVK